MTPKKVIHMIRAESKDDFPTKGQNTMVLEVHPSPDKGWIVLFTNSWEMERAQQVPPEYTQINFGFDYDNLKRLTVTYPSALDKRRIEQEMKNLGVMADRDSIEG